MLRHILHRVFLMVPTVLAISILSFLIIQAPPGDYVTVYVASLEELGQIVDQAQIEALRKRYGLGKSLYVQYLKWI